MKLSERVEWALHCTWTLAAAPSAEPVSTRRLAEFYDLPAPYLAKALNSLVRAGILHATSGPRGGFRLARPATEITAADVVEAIEGRGQLFTCTEIRQRGPVPLTGVACRKQCGISRLMDRAERAWWSELAATTIADLVGAPGVGVPDRLSKWIESTEKDGTRSATAAGNRN
jgi:Rrf2 family protein